MYKIAYTKSWKPGQCELCGKSVDHLERHHITYQPEKTRDICHECHFKCHHFPDRLTEFQILKLLIKVMPINLAQAKIKEAGRNRVKRALLIAPSRRESIHRIQNRS